MNLHHKALRIHWHFERKPRADSVVIWSEKRNRFIRLICGLPEQIITPR